MNQFYKLMLIITFSLFLFSSTAFPQVLFNKHIIDDNYDGACAVYAIDVDGDTLIDVLSAAWNANTLAWWKNEGGVPVNWTKYIIDNSFQGASFVFAEDVDGDEDIDVLGSAWDDNELAWWRNEGGNPVQWTKQIIADSCIDAHEIHTSDIDGDLDIDVLGAAAGSHEIGLWLNEGGDPITWTKQTIDQEFIGARSVIACDVNDDDLMDIVGAALGANDIALWLNGGGNPIQWTKQTIENNFGGAHWVRAFDMDNDNDYDLLGAAAISNSIAWWKNDGGDPIVWTRQIIEYDFNGALSVSAADLDRDYDMDVFGAATNSNTVSWWRNEGNLPISWTEITIDGSFYGAWPVYGEDIDNDGDIDILGAAYYANDLVWWENNLITGIERDNADKIGVDYNLNQNYPNPFNPSTTISFHLPNQSLVSLKVFDVLGNEIAILVNEEKPAGEYEVIFHSGELPNGVYFYRLRSMNYVETKKMLLLK